MELDLHIWFVKCVTKKTEVDHKALQSPSTAWTVHRMHATPASRSHRNIRRNSLQQINKVVPIEDRTKHQTLMKNRLTYCEEHKVEQLKLHCYDCKTPICLMCDALKHKTHHYEEINESARKFSQNLQNCFPQLMDCIQATENEIIEQDKDKKELLKKISDTNVTRLTAPTISC